MDSKENHKIEKFKRLHEGDCKIDWEHFLIEDEDGALVEEKISPEDAKSMLATWMEEECSCSEYKLADKESCYMYYIYSHEYDVNKYKQYAKQYHYTDDNISFLGLQEMFDNGWAKSPAFIDWKDEMKYCITGNNISNFILGIIEPQTRVDILSYLLKNVEYIFMQDALMSWDNKEYMKKKKLSLKELLERQKEAAKIRKEELTKQAAEQRKQAKEQAKEYSVTFEEIVEYAEQEAGEHQYAIKAMLRYFCLEKTNWNTKAIRNKIHEIGNQTNISIGTNNATVIADSNVDFHSK